MKLTKVAEISLAGVKYDVAKNGEHFHLVRADGEDAYGEPRAVRVGLESFLIRQPTGQAARLTEARLDNAQALLDALGEALVALRASRAINLRPDKEA